MHYKEAIVALIEAHQQANKARDEHGRNAARDAWNGAGGV